MTITQNLIAALECGLFIVVLMIGVAGFVSAIDQKIRDARRK